MTKLIVIILVHLFKMVPYVYLFILYQTVLCLKTDHLTIIYIHQYMHAVELYVVYTIQQIRTQDTSVHSTGP
jgi:hypothetical protein